MGGTSMTSTTKHLDHLIFLSSDLSKTTSIVENLGFQVIQGGNHADGKTTNVLICLPDGVYLEVIAFTSEKAKEGHWWGCKALGWIDWCLLGYTDAQGYKKPMHGGRKRPDGKELEWEVSMPVQSDKGWPFFCYDLTPREIRVPSDKMTHPNGGQGIKSITLLHRAGSSYEQEVKAIFSNITSPSGQVIETIIRQAENDTEEKWIQAHGEGFHKAVVQTTDGTNVELSEDALLQ